MSGMSKPILRNADGLVTPAVAGSVENAGLEQQDEGLKRLALTYAKAIDDADEEDRAAVLRDLGPKLQSALESLGCSPAGRAKAAKPGGEQVATSALARMQARRSG